MIDEETAGTQSAADAAQHAAESAATGAAKPGSVAVHIPGDTIAAKIDALHASHFAGTELANNTPLWNKVIAFREEVKKLLAEVVGDAEALIKKL